MPRRRGAAVAPPDSTSLFSGGAAMSSGVGPPGPRLVHHSWVKVKVHNYVCRKCGMRKVHVEKSPNSWIAEWHTPDGDVLELRLSPGCALGSHTAERLAWLADWEAKQSSPAVGAEAGEVASA